MKKIIVVSAVAALMTMAFSFSSAMATEEPTTVTKTGSFYVDIAGASQTWADGENTYTKSMSGGQYIFNATMGDENNGLKVQSVGGYLGEAEGPYTSAAGGSTKGFGEYGYQFTLPTNY